MYGWVGVDAAQHRLGRVSQAFLCVNTGQCGLIWKYMKIVHTGRKGSKQLTSTRSALRVSCHTQPKFESDPRRIKTISTKGNSNQPNITYYLRKCLPDNFTTILSKFRTSSHELLIEKGRYTNILRIERKFQKCDLKGA